MNYELPQKFRFLTKKDFEPRDYSGKAVKYCSNLTNKSNEEKLKILDILLRLPFYLTFSSSEKKKFNSLFENLYSTFYEVKPYIADEEEWITEAIEKAFQLPKDINNSLVDYLNNIKQNEEHLKEIENELERFYDFITEKFEHRHITAVQKHQDYFSNAYLLTQFYEKNNILQSEYKFHTLLSLYSITYIPSLMKKLKRLDLIEGAYNYYYDLKVCYTMIDVSVLNTILQITNDFADYLDLNLIEEWDRLEAEFKAAYDFSFRDDAEREILIFFTL